jgi:2-polyprenyl-3-methyl-5-hydroxy-6-metoxy-1,4-benzoquinol methylase
MKLNENTVEVDNAKKKVREQFPFPGYLDNSLDIAANIASVIKKYLQPGAKILDFGSGALDKTAVIQCLGYECSAFDDLQDEWHVLDNNVQRIKDFAKQFNIDFKHAAEGYLPFEKESFDMVMSHDVLEHLHDSPRELLNDLVELIKPNGLLFITVPNAANIRKRMSLLMGNTNLPDFSSYYWYPGPWRGHVREYVKNDLKLLCEYLGFRIEELRGCHHMLKRVPARIRPAYLFLTNIFPDWRDSWVFVGRKPRNWQAKRNLSRSEFNKTMGKVSAYYLSQ